MVGMARSPPAICALRDAGTTSSVTNASTVIFAGSAYIPYRGSACMQYTEGQPVCTALFCLAIPALLVFSATQPTSLAISISHCLTPAVWLWQYFLSPSLFPSRYLARAGTVKPYDDYTKGT
jgi:hypothetical protein